MYGRSIVHPQLSKAARKSWLVVLLLCFLALALPATAQTDSAQLRLGQFVFDSSALNLYVDSTVIAGEDGAPSAWYPMTLPFSYLNFSAGAHSFALTADGEALESAIVGAQELTLEAGHKYLLAVLGNVIANDVHMSLIDETAAIAQMDISQSAVSVLINNLYGIPAIDMSFAGNSIADNLAYGDYILMQDPTEGSGSLITAHGDPNSVVFELAEAVGSPANIFAVFVFSGKFPGTLGEDYIPFYSGQYQGDLTIIDGGAIAVGDSVPVAITDMGQRVDFTLTLDSAMTLDILQAASSADGQDAFLRILNSAGDTLYENDELTHEDDESGGFDAGWQGLQLDAGTYVLEVGTFVDTRIGDFTLSVTAAK